MRKICKIQAGVIPRYSLFPLILALFFNTAVYEGARMIAGKWYHYNMESSLDHIIPFWPPAISVYLGCYLFWTVNYILIARQEREAVYQFFWSDFLSRIICLFFFLLIPTTNIRPYVAVDGFWNRAILWLYSADAADNLFPSIHCLVSWLCYIGIRKSRNIPLWYKVFSLVMALMVCGSTLLTKQHVVADVIGGVLLAEICIYIGRRKGVPRFYKRLLLLKEGREADA